MLAFHVAVCQAGHLTRTALKFNYVQLWSYFDMPDPLERFFTYQYSANKAHYSEADWNAYFSACIATNRPRIAVVTAKNQCWVDYDATHTRIRTAGCEAEIKNGLRDIQTKFSWPNNAGINCSVTVVHTRIGIIYRVPLENWLDVASMLGTVFENRRIDDTKNAG